MIHRAPPSPAATAMLGRERVEMLGDLERCLAWAILEDAL